MVEVRLRLHTPLPVVSRVCATNATSVQKFQKQEDQEENQEEDQEEDQEAAQITGGAR